MSYKKIVSNIIALLVLFILFYLVNKNSEFQLKNSLFLSGISLIFFSIATQIIYGGIFDSLQYTFVKLKYYTRKKSFIKSKNETDAKEIQKNLDAPPSEFYDYIIQKQAERTKATPIYGYVIGLISIIVSVIL